MSLPERPGFLHAVPVLDIFALLWLLFLLGPSLLRQSGISVDLPPSRFQLERFQDNLVVTLGPGEGEPRIHLGRDAVTMADLAERLKKLRTDGATTNVMVLLQTDSGTPVGMERQVSELILSRGFRLAMVGANQGSNEEREDPAEEPPSNAPSSASPAPSPGSPDLPENR